MPIPEAKGLAHRYLSCLRPQDILVLQGSPLLGAAFAILHPGVKDLAKLATLLAANVFLVSHIFMLNDWSGLTADAADPNKADAYFIKGSLMMGDSKQDKDGKLQAPAGTAEALNKYLELEPDGKHANDVKQMLTYIGAKIETSYKDKKKK